MNYLNALYRRNSNGKPCVWYLDIGNMRIDHGIVGGNIISEPFIPVQKDFNKECESKIKDKIKKGYKYIRDLKDDNELPTEQTLYEFLNTYLPVERRDGEDRLLAMLAKSYDNTNNKLFNKCSNYLGQYKINGLRCFIKVTTQNDFFRPYVLTFQPREGGEWKSLSILEDYIIAVLGHKRLQFMVDNDIILDGELYIPGESINEINSAVKNINNPKNKLVQYWCYDLAIEDNEYYQRILLKERLCLDKFILSFIDKNSHLNNDKKFVVLDDYYCDSGNAAINLRDRFIALGFEGLILRNPHKEYQFGTRNLAMIKYKKSTDGKFKIIDIKSEGAKRPDIPLFICKNDINDELFECHVGGTEDYQKSVLVNKDKYIGRHMFVEFGERSGVKQVPFHIKETYIIPIIQNGNI